MLDITLNMLRTVLRIINIAKSMYKLNRRALNGMLFSNGSKIYYTIGFLFIMAWIGHLFE